MNKYKEKFNNLATLELFIYLIVFSLPLYLVRLNFFIPTNLLEVLIIIFMGASLLEKANRIKISAFFKKNRKYLIGFLILILSFLLSALLNENSLKGLSIIKSWFVLPFLFSTMAYGVLEKEQRKNVFVALYYSASTLALLGLVFVIFGKLTYDGRLEAVFNSPNYLAMYLAPGFLSGFFLIKKGFLRKTLPLSLIVVALFFTYSYLAWISLLIVTGVLIRGLKLSQKAILIGIVVIVIVSLSLAFKAEKMNDIVSFNKRSSLASRSIIWQSAGKMLAEDGILGIGPSNFQERYLANQEYYPPYLEWAVPHPHSTYLALWLGGGLMGIITFIAILFYWFKDFILRNKKETILGIVSLGIILYFLLHGVADTTYFKNDLAIIFWLSFFSLL